jgi:hypothetical protein
LVRALHVGAAYLELHQFAQGQRVVSTEPKGAVINTDMIKAYVESLLEDLTEAEKVRPDHDGDYPIKYRSAQYYVRVLDGREPVVQIFAVAVADVKGTDSLMRDLNEINTQLRFCRAFWVRDQVLFEGEHLGLTRNDFNERIAAVASAADHFGGELAARRAHGIRRRAGRGLHHTGRPARRGLPVRSSRASR